jgi:hypothetical protein
MIRQLFTLLSISAVNGRLSDLQSSPLNFPHLPFLFDNDFRFEKPVRILIDKIPKKN